MKASPNRARDLFLAAARLVPDDWDAFLARECGDDLALRGRVRDLLAAHQQAGTFLEPAAGLPPTIDEPIAERPGTVIGPYKLLEQVGEGGFGIVFMAEQSEPVRRKVALKVLKPGVDTRQVVARFEAERQALAIMDHPNIAKVFDGGTTPSGRPYFVMELVRGVPITAYCDQAHLTPRERLELFVPVCQAIQHAHQKGVIHRDLKPSNVLVSAHDGRPTVKVIDFGVAKAVGQELTDKTLFTAFAQLVGTPLYMSPEQAAQSPDIDTRTDVYSLGVLLYELLTGTTPFTRERFRTAAYDEIRRIIREEDPPKPSTRISESKEALPSISALRHTEPAKLRKLVRGELDWIVMKALEKDRTRRYDTANGFAQDVQRYLADEQVLACPPSTAYRVRKLLRRNRAAVLTAALVAAALVAGTAVASWQAVRATRAEAEEAKHRQAAEQNETAARQAAEAERQATQAAQDERNKAVEARQKTAAALEGERFTAYVHRIALAHREWLAHDVARARQLLDECPDDLRDWEWHYLRRLCNTELVAFGGHATEVTALAFSPDGNRVASVSRAEARVWDSATGREAYQVPVTGQSGCAGAAFTRDGKRLAVAGHQQVTLHDAADGKEVRRIRVYDRPVPPKGRAQPRMAAVAFSPDGRRLATAGGGVYGIGEVKVWDADTGRLVRTLGDLPVLANAVAFSPDGKYLVASTTGTTGESPWPGEVRVWDAADFRLVHKFQAYDQDTVHPGQIHFVVTGVAVSPDSTRVVAAVSDGTVRVWELPGGREVLALRGHTGRVNGVAFSPQGDRLASVGQDRVVRVWDAATGWEANVIRGHTRPVVGVAFSPDGRRLATAGGEVRVWDARVDQEARTFLRDPTAPGVFNVAFGPVGTLLASASMTEVQVHEVATGRARPPAAVIRPGAMSPPGPVVRFSPDGATLATTGMEGVKLWDPVTGERLRFFPDQEPADQKWVLVTTDLAFSPDGRRLATVGGGLLVVWETATARVIHTIPTQADFVAFSPDGRRIAAGISEALTPVQGKKGLQTVPAEVRVWDAESGRELMRLAGGDRGVAYSPDGTRLAAGREDGTATVWDAGNGEVLFTLRGHSGRVSGLAFSRDGRRLATAGVDHTIRIWDTRMGREVFVLRGHGAPVAAVAFSPDGHHLASASPAAPSQVRLWNASPPGPSVLPPQPPVEAKARPALLPKGPVLSARLPAGPKPADEPGPVISATNAGRLRRVAELEKDGDRILAGPGRGELALLDLVWDPDKPPVRSFEVVEEATFRPSRTLDPGFRPVDFAASPDGRRVAWSVWGDTRIAVQELDGGKGYEIETDARGPSPVFSPDGARLAAGSSDTRAKVWDAATGRPVRTFDTGGRGVRRPAFSPDGKLLATGYVNGPILLFDIDSGQLVHTLDRRSAQELAFGADGKVLAAVYRDGSVALWEVATGRLLHSAATGAKEAYTLAWGPKGDVLATAGYEGKIVVWAAEGLTKLAERDAPALVNQVRFTWDGTRLLSAGGPLGTGPPKRAVTVWAVAP